MNKLHLVIDCSLNILLNEKGFEIDLKSIIFIFNITAPKKIFTLKVWGTQHLEIWGRGIGMQCFSDFGSCNEPIVRI